MLFVVNRGLTLSHSLVDGYERDVRVLIGWFGNRREELTKCRTSTLDVVSSLGLLDSR